MTDAGATGVVARDRERAVLAAAAEEATAGRGRIVLVHGPAGIGKSTLLRDAVARARGGGWTVLTARGSESERDVPFGVTRTLLESRVHADPGLLDGAARPARVIFDEEHTGGGEPGADGSPHAILRGLFWIVAALARGGPVLVAIDDLHWADDRSQRFLDTLRVRLDDLPVLLVVATRDGVGTALDHWFGDGGVVGLPVPPLDVMGVRALVRARLADVDDALCDACAEVSGGNPYLAGALLAELERRPELRTVDAVRRLTPAAVVRATAARLSTLGPTVAAVAQAAAVLGGAVVPRRVASLTGLDADAVATALDGLRTAGLLEETDGAVVFPHPLTLAAVRDSAGPAGRERLAAAAGRLLADEPGELDRACAHLLLAPPEGDPAVVEVLARGATSALARGAPAEARALLRRALDEPPPPGEVAAIAARVSEASFLAGHPDVVDDALGALASAPDPAGRLRAAIVAGHALTLAGRGDEAVRTVQAHVDPAAGEDLVREGMGLVTVWGTTTLAARHLTRPLTEGLLAAVADPAVPQELLAIAALERVVGTGTADDVVDHATRACGDGALLRRHGANSPLTTAPVYALAVAGAHGRAEVIADEVLAAARDGGILPGTMAALGGRGMSRALRGDLAGAEADLRGALELDPGSEDVGLLQVFHHVALSRVLRATRGPDAATEVLESVPTPARDPDAIGGIRWVAERAWVALAAGRPQDALRDVAVLARFDERWPSSGIWTDRRPIEAWARAACGDPDGARTAAADAVRAARRFGAARPIVDALRASARADPTAGETHLEEALALARAAGLPTAEVALLADLGTYALDAGATDRARVVLDEAAVLAERCGADALGARIQAEVVRAGARPRRFARTGAAALTPSERRIAELVGAGRTNRQVAEELFLTEKTVENHLTSVYRKLGVRSRTQVAAALTG